MNPQLNRQISLETDECLLIFDPHQHMDWLRALIEKEKDNVSHLLLGGDYWDTWDSEIPPRKGVKAMASYLVELAEHGAGLARSAPAQISRIVVLSLRSRIHFPSARLT